MPLSWLKIIAAVSCLNKRLHYDSLNYQKEWSELGMIGITYFAVGADAIVEVATFGQL